MLKTQKKTNWWCFSSRSNSRRKLGTYGVEKAGTIKTTIAGLKTFGSDAADVVKTAASRVKNTSKELYGKVKGKLGRRANESRSAGLAAIGTTARNLTYII